MSIPLNIINQVFELQQKVNTLQEAPGFERNFSRLFNVMEEEGFLVQNPLNEAYTESRTDCEASIVGEPASKMIITKVLKPVIYHKAEGQLRLVQKAVVIVEKK
ncbi:MAG: hypothetical protein QM687_10155 [Ferruginibacter sp.]